MMTKAKSARENPAETYVRVQKIATAISDAELQANRQKTLRLKALRSEQEEAARESEADIAATSVRLNPRKRAE